MPDRLGDGHGSSIQRDAVNRDVHLDGCLVPPAQRPALGNRGAAHGRSIPQATPAASAGMRPTTSRRRPARGPADAEQRPVWGGHRRPPRAASVGLVHAPRDASAEPLEPRDLRIRVVHPEVEMHGRLARRDDVDALDHQAGSWVAPRAARATCTHRSRTGTRSRALRPEGRCPIGVHGINHDLVDEVRTGRPFAGVGASWVIARAARQPTVSPRRYDSRLSSGDRHDRPRRSV